MRAPTLAIALLLEACCMGAERETTSPVAPSVPAPETGRAPELVVGALPVSVHVPAAPRFAFEVERAGEYQLDAAAAPMSAQLRLFSGDDVVMQDGGGGSTDARLLTFLEPGSYTVQVSEWRSRALEGRVSLRRLPPMTPVATLVPGDARVIVQCPMGDSPREASVEATLTIETAGTYRIEASSSDGSRDAELALLFDGGLIQADSDSGEETDAEIVRELSPGSYTLRVRDWRNRDAALSLHVIAGAPGP